MLSVDQNSLRTSSDFSRNLRGSHRARITILKPVEDVELDLQPAAPKRHRFGSSLSRASNGKTANEEKFTLEDVLNESDFDTLNQLFNKCNTADQKLQKKMDYYYGAYGKYQDCQPLLPLDFASDEGYVENVHMKWGALAKIILQNNSQTCDNLIKSVAGDIYARLKELSDKVQKPKFRKVLAYIDELLKTEMNENYDDLPDHEKPTEEERKLRSLIALLFMIKRGKLDKIVSRISKSNRRKRNKTQ